MLFRVPYARRKVLCDMGRPLGEQVLSHRCRIDVDRWDLADVPT